MTKRTRLIIGAIALLFLFPYLGGLLAQCAHAAFASPSEPVPAILLSPFICYRYACTLSGLQYTLLTIAIVCGAGFWFGKRFGGDVDARNFTRSKKGTYGTAGWMNASERQAFLENVSPEQPKGTILGTDGVPCSPAGQYAVQQAHRDIRCVWHTQKPRIRPSLFAPVHSAR